MAVVVDVSAVFDVVTTLVTVVGLTVKVLVQKVVLILAEASHKASVSHVCFGNRGVGEEALAEVR